MNRITTYSIDAIFALMEGHLTEEVASAGFKLRVKSPRLVLFREKGVDCVTCDAQGAFFALEQHTDETPHLNLYALRDGREVLMTKDHVRPRALGGKDDQKNYAPMCTLCNGKKGSRYSGLVAPKVA